jgi:hypothetical protein
MSQSFRLAQGDVTVVGHYAEPAFIAFRETSSLIKAIYDALSIFGLRLADLKIERGTGSVADLHLLCSLFNLAMSIQVRVDRVEVLCFDTLRLSQEQFVAVARKTLEVVGETVANKRYSSYSLTANFHGSVDGTTTRDYLTKLVGAGPAKIGPLLASGAVFYYGPEAERLSSFLSVDLSGVRADAVYVRPHVVWDATKVTLTDLPTIAESFLRSAFEGLGLNWPVLPSK